MKNHIHLDLVGGLSGDMFISAMLDAFPDLAEGLEDVITAAGFPDLVKLQHQPHDDGTLTGTRFRVVSVKDESHHHHRHYAEIRESLSGSDLAVETKTGALQMFRLLAEAEASIHGEKVDEVAFHEVGAWDSIADIVLAAHLISCVNADSWSISRIPLGSGFVETAHGRLPVPAPATAKLLEGFDVADDGIEGERVTPTGAVILKYLSPARRVPDGCTMAGSGYGFGSKVFPGISNTVRVCVYSKTGSELPWSEDRVMRLSFELDDQTPESIAQAIETLRAEDGVLDVTQQPYWGKKNRQGFSITIMTSAESVDAVTSLCFSVTTTLGIRREAIARATLEREQVVVYVNERAFRVKVAKRPTGYTAKIEMDDLMAAELSLEEQEKVRQTAEALALEQVWER